MHVEKVVVVGKIYLPPSNLLLLLLILFRFLLCLLYQLFPLAAILFILLSFLFVEPSQFLDVALQVLLVLSAHVQDLKVGFVQLEQGTTLDRVLHEGGNVVLETDTEQPLADLLIGPLLDGSTLPLVRIAQPIAREAGRRSG